MMLQNLSTAAVVIGLETLVTISYKAVSDYL